MRHAPDAGMIIKRFLTLIFRVIIIARVIIPRVTGIHPPCLPSVIIIVAVKMFTQSWDAAWISHDNKVTHWSDTDIPLCADTYTDRGIVAVGTHSVYCCGGAWNQEPERACHRLDVATRTWHMLPPLVHKRRGCRAVYYNE